MAKIFSGTVTVKLEQSFAWEDNPSVSEIALNFGKMNGKIATEAERAVNVTGNFSFVPALNADYCKHVAAAISGMPVRVFDKMPYADFDVIRQTVGAFIGGRNPQRFYDQFMAGDDEDEDDYGAPAAKENEDFTNPA